MTRILVTLTAALLFCGSALADLVVYSYTGAITYVSGNSLLDSSQPKIGQIRLQVQ